MKRLRKIIDLIFKRNVYYAPRIDKIFVEFKLLEPYAEAAGLIKIGEL